MVAIPEIEHIKPNFSKVTVGNIHFYFSYNTVIAVKKGNKLLISENLWSSTTGKHLNEIDPDKKKRLSRKDFMAQIKALK